MLLSVLPCPDAVCYTLPVQLERVGGESFKLPHVLFQHTSVDKMPVGLGKQTVPLVGICWQLTLRQSHWEWSGHLQLHRIGAGLCSTTWLAGLNLMSSKACRIAAGTLPSLRVQA